jgi:hypothetical protein
MGYAGTTVASAGATSYTEKLLIGNNTTSAQGHSDSVPVGERQQRTPTTVMHIEEDGKGTNTVWRRQEVWIMVVFKSIFPYNCGANSPLCCSVA